MSLLNSLCKICASTSILNVSIPHRPNTGLSFLFPPLILILTMSSISTGFIWWFQTQIYWGGGMFISWYFLLCEKVSHYISTSGFSPHSLAWLENLKRRNLVYILRALPLSFLYWERCPQGDPFYIQKEDLLLWRKACPGPALPNPGVSIMKSTCHSYKWHTFPNIRLINKDDV